MPFDNIPEGAYLVLTELAVTGLSAYVIYGMYKTCTEQESILNVLKIAPSLTVGSELVQAVANSGSDDTIQYAAVRGKVDQFGGNVITPSKNGVPSVVRVVEHSEIKSKYAWDFSRYSFDGDKYQTTEFSPFCLRPSTDTPISINFYSSAQPNNPSVGSGADTHPILIINDISVPQTQDLLIKFPTYYETVVRPSASKILDYLFGLSTLTGIHKTEKLLPVNAMVTAVGRITKTAEGQYTLGGPSLPNALYILTTTPFEDIREEYHMRVFQGYFLIFLLASGTAYLVCDLMKRLKVIYDDMYPKPKHVKKDSPKQCDTDDAHNQIEDLSSDSQLCIVCHERARNVVLMNCRHFCTCETCSYRLGRYCPLCRQRVVESITVFVS